MDTTISLPHDNDSRSFSLTFARRYGKSWSLLPCDDVSVARSVFSFFLLSLFCICLHWLYTIYLGVCKLALLAYLVHFAYHAPLLGWIPRLDTAVGYSCSETHSQSYIRVVVQVSVGTSS
jgi:hypothetical protein